VFDLVRASITGSSSGWPVSVAASHLDGAPAAVFVYQTAAPPLTEDFFSCVASAPQMTELLEDSGDAGQPFYRVAALSVICRSPAHAAEFWEKIQRSVSTLADNLALVDALSPAETITI
jgi:hypothetical protein